MPRAAFLLPVLALAALAGCGPDPTAHLSPERAEPYVLRLQDACLNAGAAASDEMLGAIAQELNARGLAVAGPDLPLEPCQKALAR
ncbi:MAG: hypothetical protein ACK5LJ_15455 [Paracoccus sp. (in: a-proteobacteria)]